MAVSAAWKAAVLRSGAALRFLVTIDDDTTQWKIIDDLCGQVDYDVALIRVDAIPSEYDPKSHVSDSGRMSLAVIDDWIRPIAVANRLKGMKVTVALGEESLTEGNFEDFWVGFIDEVAPEPGGNVVVIECLDVYAYIDDMEATGAWVDRHPLEVVEDVLLTKIRLDASLVDAVHLAPTHADNAANSHLNVTRFKCLSSNYYPDHTIWEPRSAKELVGELMSIVNGALVVDSTGKLSPRLFNSAAAAVADWTVDDIQELRQLSDWETMLNQITINAAGGGFYSLNDDDSQGNHAFGVATANIVTETIDLDWLKTGSGFAWETIGTADPEVITVSGGIGFAGFNTLAPTPGSQNAALKLSASRPGYWLIRTPEESRGEIVKVTAQPTPTWYGNLRYNDPQYGAIATARTDIVDLFTASCARAQLGTTKQAFPRYSSVIDITAQVYMAESRIKRYGAAAPKIEVTTSLGQIDVGLADLVTITWPNYLGYGADGITSSTKWEVVSREIDVYSDTPNIKFTLIRATVGSPTTSHEQWDDSLRRPSERKARAVINNYVSRPRVVSGFKIAQSAGLVATLPGGVIATADDEFNHPNDGLTSTMTASKDTYIYLDTLKGAFVNKEVANAAARPADEVAHLPLAKVITDGSGITSVEDLRFESFGSIGSAGLNTDDMQAAGECPNGTFGEW